MKRKSKHTKFVSQKLKMKEVMANNRVSAKKEIRPGLVRTVSGVSGSKRGRCQMTVNGKNYGVTGTIKGNKFDVDAKYEWIVDAYMDRLGLERTPVTPKTEPVATPKSTPTKSATVQRPKVVETPTEPETLTEKVKAVWGFARSVFGRGVTSKAMEDGEVMTRPVAMSTTPVASSAQKTEQMDTDFPWVDARTKASDAWTKASDARIKASDVSAEQYARLKAANENYSNSFVEVRGDLRAVRVKSVATGTIGFRYGGIEYQGVHLDDSIKINRIVRTRDAKNSNRPIYRVGTSLKIIQR
jgi:hypothetical protein